MPDQFPNVFDSLGPSLSSRAKALVAKREANGLNVHFTNSRGEPDRRSFARAYSLNRLTNGE